MAGQEVHYFENNLKDARTLLIMDWNGDPQSALQFHYSFTLPFTHWQMQAMIIATAALGQADRRQAAILLQFFTIAPYGQNH